MKIFSTWGEGRGIADFSLRADNVILNSGKDLYQPCWMKGLEALPMLVVRINKVAKCVEVDFAERYYNEVSLAFSLRAVGLSDGIPMRMQEDFDGSFVRWSDWEELEDLKMRELEVVKIIRPTELGEPCGLNLPTRMEIAETIAEVSKYYLLKIGDWIALPAMTTTFEMAPGNGLMMYEGEKQELIYVGIK